MLQCLQALQIKSHSLLTILLILGGSWVTQWKSMKTLVLFWPRPDRPITIQMFSGLVTRGPSSKNTPRPAPDCDGISRYQPTCWGWSRPTSCTCSPNNCQWSSDHLTPLRRRVHIHEAKKFPVKNPERIQAKIAAGYFRGERRGWRRVPRKTLRRNKMTRVPEAKSLSVRKWLLWFCI